MKARERRGKLATSRWLVIRPRSVWRNTSTVVRPRTVKRTPRPRGRADAPCTAAAATHDGAPPAPADAGPESGVVTSER